MVISVSTRDLPSGGYNLSQQKVYDIHPATFKQIMKYEQYPTNTYVQRLRRDLIMLKDDISDLNTISMFDIDALIFLKKLISVSKAPEVSFTVVCSKCGHMNKIIINLDDMTYKNIKKEALNITYIDLGGIRYPVNIPTAGYMMRALDTFYQYKEDVNPKVFIVSCLLGFNDNYEVKKAVENATLEDIILIDKLYNMMSGASKLAEYECQSCHKKGAVEVNQISTDFFRDIFDNCKLPEDKIIFNEGVSNRRGKSGSLGNQQILGNPRGKDEGVKERRSKT